MSLANKKPELDDDEHEDFVTEDDFSSQALAQMQDAVEARTSNVKNLITRGDTAEAVRKALEDPVVGKAPEALKQQNLQTVLMSLSSTRTSDIPTIVKSLSSEQLDTLMKFVYAGMARTELGLSGQLLVWHEKIVEAAGVGCIVRVLSDRKTV